MWHQWVLCGCDGKCVISLASAAALALCEVVPIAVCRGEIQTQVVLSVIHSGLLQKDIVVAFHLAACGKYVGILVSIASPASESNNIRILYMPMVFILGAILSCLKTG
jgi:hypothetical protein